MRQLQGDVIRMTVTISSYDLPTLDEHSYAARLVRCDWCGRVRWTPSGKPYGYRYGTLSPMLRASWESHTFCCKSCRDAYHV